ncbi:hypothetical protein HMPREF9057_01730 [Actinomyces sp. oral taxon 171 str. F0337]|nr:hypothetical protein HMPREF9057_01730 [Actinomyces sp. oral taxon 171 str. F0337]
MSSDRVVPVRRGCRSRAQLGVRCVGVGTVGCGSRSRVISESI